jgi:hypothetical protein
MEICELCGKEITENEIYHIEYRIGHLECFQAAVEEYINKRKKGA